VGVRLRSYDILLNAIQRLLRFGYRQTQVGEIARPSGRLIAITSTPRD
jgi:hypothetical protein